MTTTSMNKEMTKLVSLIAKADIPFEIIGTDRTNCYDGSEYITYNICVPDSDTAQHCSGAIDAASADTTYGGRRGLIEVMGFRGCECITDNDVVGYLTAEEAFEYINKAWEIISK